MKANAMIDQLDVAIGREGHVTRLSIGIIDPQVKDHDWPKQLHLIFRKCEVGARRFHVKEKLQ